MRITPVLLLPFLLPACGGDDAPAPGAMTAAALADSTVAWETRHLPHLRVHVPAGSYAAEHVDSLTALVVEARMEVLGLLGVSDYDPVIDVFFVPDREAMQRYTGLRVTGLADTGGRTIFLVTNPEWRAFPKHELMHILAVETWGAPRAPGDWINEGLAQFADARCGAYDVDVVARDLMQAGGEVPLDTLVQDFRSLDDLTAYLQAASLVGFVFRTHGRTAVHWLWRDGIEALPDVTGQTVDQVLNAWRAELAAAGPGPSAAELAVIRDKGCG